MAKTLLIMAGGTGGHIFPGLAVADVLRHKGWNIHWLGTPKRMEARIVPEHGYPLHFIDVEGVRGNGVVRLLAAPFKIIGAIWQSYKVIKQVQPDVVLGMGGFASGPGGVAARLRGIPLLLHEQNALPGLTNKLLSRIACKVLTGFDNTFKQQGQSQKYQWVGNPVREAVVALHGQTKPVDLPVNVLVVGGSLGARVLNQKVPEAVAAMPSGKFAVRHQSGAGNQAQVEQAYKNLNFNAAQVQEFINDMADAYAWADIVICRAGALTVSEVAAAGVAAIFVPLPHAVDDHQTKNALVLVNAGAAQLLPQRELEAGQLVTRLAALLDDPGQLSDMAENARSVAKLEAAEQVAECCNVLAENNQ